MLKILLITPSVKENMPYFDNYILLLKRTKIDLVVTSYFWNREGKIVSNTSNEIYYTDNKKSMSRGIVDYLFYFIFLLKKINFDEFDFIVLFGVPLIFFFSFYKKISYKIILDIRDFHILCNFFDLKRVINRSLLTSISSEGFGKFTGPNVSVFHNFYQFPQNCSNKIIYDDINIVNFGILRDRNINKKLIKILKNVPKFQLIYYGYGKIYKYFSSFSKINKIDNVIFKGQYSNQNIAFLISKFNLVNCFLDNNKNSSMLLPNRLYHALSNCIPVITNKGTYLAFIVEKFKLGLVVNDINHVKKQIETYIADFNFDDFIINRNKFFIWITNDNANFETKIINILEGKIHEN